MWVGFLYTEVVILLLFLSMRMSRNGSFPLFSFSIVNVMDGLCVLRCFKNFSISLSPEAILRIHHRHILATSLFYALQMLWQFVRSVPYICC